MNFFKWFLALLLVIFGLSQRVEGGSCNCATACYASDPNHNDCSNQQNRPLGDIGSPGQTFTGDRCVDGDDVEGFTLLLTSDICSTQPCNGTDYPTYCCAADTNQDGNLDGDDIDPFIALLTGGCPEEVREFEEPWITEPEYMVLE